ncbi:Protein RGF1 INDUCIBLE TRANSCRIPTION FACTOR 1 [Ancistrocladus abbreviatus]
MVGLGPIPQWLDVLLRESFFTPCLIHVSAKKNERNIFCLDCCLNICPQCLHPHRKHRLLQIRRYVYHDVLRLKDAEKLMDCSFVQPYITNSAKVVFLKQRPLTRLFKSSGNACITCHRNLQDPYLFCCLSCKVQHTVATQGRVRTPLSSHQTLETLELDDYQITSDSVLDPPASLPTSSGSTTSSGGHGPPPQCTVFSTATTEFVKKKRSNLSVFRVPHRPKCPPAATETAASNRRKGIPKRSPFY